MMKVVCSAFLLVVLLSTSTVVAVSDTTLRGSGSSSSSSSNDETIVTNDGVVGSFNQDIFNTWMNEFQKEYKTVGEFTKRMKIWFDNHVFIEEHNSIKDPLPSYELGHNQFSDLTFDEYKQYNKLGEHSPGIVTNTIADRVKPDFSLADTTTARRLDDDDKPPADYKNWVEDGGVVPIKNQGMCGSCWAFSAIGAIEGAHYVDTGNLISLSEQQLVDCDKLDLGCGGGLMDNAFLFDENSTGICSEDDYPYAGHKRWFRGCATTQGLCTGVDHTRVKTFIDVPNTVDDLVGALSKQPVSVAIEADQRSFQFYKSGVYADAACGNRLDHGVLAVGYGTENNTDYFLVRNSWGLSWGDGGYIKMARDSNNVNGTCGILSVASRPILRDDN